MGSATQVKKPWTAMTGSGIEPLRYASPPVCISVPTQSWYWCCHQQKRINHQNQMLDASLVRLCGMRENNYLVPVSARVQQLERTDSVVHCRGDIQWDHLLDEAGTEFQTWWCRSQTPYPVNAVMDDCFIRGRRTLVATARTAASTRLCVALVHRRCLG